MGITVLSLFDGISCGQLALQRAGIKVDRYLASEVDKYAIKITQKNFPNTEQLGDVKNVWARNLPKIDLPDGEYTMRKLSPTECERLQTLPDNYTEGISNTQRYKCIGNGWTADVIAHIFGFIKEW